MPSPAELDSTKDNINALKDAKQPLKTQMPNAEQKHPPKYVIELNATQTVRPLGKDPVEPVRQAPPDAREAGKVEPTDDTSVLLERPSLDSLIGVQGKLNPFSLDAQYYEKVDLRDVLNTAVAQNLNIEESFTQLKQQKYQVLSTASGFLPDLNGGYSLFGTHGTIPGQLFGIGTGKVKLPSSIQLLNAGFVWNAYQGGKVMFGTLEQKHRYRAARSALKESINDNLLTTATRFYDMLLQEALLSIRVRAVAISQEQVRLNTAQEKSGTATGLDVLQSQAQLASDEQNLVDQQNARRQSAIQLTHIVNASFAQDLVSADKFLKKERLIPKKIPIEELLKIAIDKRPELRQYEELRLAAKAAIVEAAAPLQPNVSLGGSVYGIGTGSNNLTPIYVLNMGVKWTLGGLAGRDLANVAKARWLSREAAVQAKQAFNDVFQQVRSSYDNCIASDKRIDRAQLQITAAEEELRIAKRRMEAGIGLNIDVLNAQRDLTQASINKAQSIVDFNTAEAQLLRDIGAIDVEGLVTGYKP